MIQRYDPSGESFLAGFARIQKKLATANEQASSGLRVASASDAPEDITDIVRLQSKISQTEQIRQNLQSVQAEAQAADVSLQSAVKLIEQAIVNASQGASTTSASTRSSLAEEVQDILEQLVNISNTTVAGRYIFSGDAADSPSYEVDLNESTGVAQLQASTATRMVETTHGGLVLAGKAASEIFDAREQDGTAAADNVFAAVNGLRAALEQGDEDAIADSLTALRAAHDHLSEALSFYGSLEKRLSTEISTASSYEDQCKIWLGDRRDADLVSNSIELAQLEVNQSAALSAMAQMPRTSLFDYLK